MYLSQFDPNQIMKSYLYPPFEMGAEAMILVSQAISKHRRYPKWIIKVYNILVGIARII